jgi:hypothetical protein
MPMMARSRPARSGRSVSASTAADSPSAARVCWKNTMRSAPKMMKLSLTAMPKLATHDAITTSPSSSPRWLSCAVSSSTAAPKP